MILSLITSFELHGQTPAAWQCPRASAPQVCDSLRSLYAKVYNGSQTTANATYVAAINRLASSTLPNDSLLAVVRILQTWHDTIKVLFLADLVGAAPTGTGTVATAHLSQNVNQLGSLLLNAWQMVQQAKKHLNYKTDFRLLQRIVTLQTTATNAANYTLLGGDIELIHLMRKNVEAPCYTCAQNKTHRRYMDDYLQDVQSFVSRFGRNINTTTNPNTNRSNAVFTSGLTAGNPGAVIGAAFMVKVLAANPTTYVPTGFEMSYPAPAGATTGGCEADAVIGSRILEFKSWSPNASDTDIGSLNDGDTPVVGSSYFTAFSENAYRNPNTNSYTQLLCYLRSVSNMINLTYIFDRDLLLSKGQSDPQAYVRRAFQTLFQRPVEQEQLFNTIWENTNTNFALRQSLFTRPTTATTIVLWRADARTQFTTAINNGTFFNFIIVH